MIDNLTFSPPNILLIDDVGSNLTILSEMICNVGYIARPVTSARQAVNAIEVLPPSLILMDISMPEVDGIEFCRILKKNIITKDIPIIFISALNTKEDKIRSFKAGAADFISKPFDVEEVMFRINIHLQMYKEKYELEISNKKLYNIINNQIMELYEHQKEIVNGIVKFQDEIDTAFEIHRTNVAHNSKLLAISLQISSKYSSYISTGFIEAIELAAHLHDIGKLIDRDIIQNRKNDTNYPVELLKSHTLLGATLLKDAYCQSYNNDFLIQAILITKYHHEHWDGTGYPDGLMGSNIPLSARIVSIINEFDHMMNFGENQPESLDKCIKRISEKAGTWFDPDIVSAFVKIHKQLKY